MIDPLRERFEAAGREVTPPPADLGGVQVRGQREKRRRMLASSGLGLLTMVIVSAAIWGISTRHGADPEPPATRPAVFVRLLTEPRGLIEIDATQGEACYRFEMRGATSAHLHRVDSEEMVIELGPNEAGRYGYLGCARGLDPGALEQVAHNPDAYVIEFHNSSSGGAEVATLRRDRGGPSCLRSQLTSSEYGLHFDTKNVMPGDEVRVWGTTLRGEDGRYAESGGFELWWNAESPQEEHRLRPDTPAIRLASVSMAGRCYFQTTFTVPDVPPGSYRITGFMFNQVASEGYGIFGNARFTVGSVSAGDGEQLAEGERWLGQVLRAVGLPYRNDFRADGGGGHSIDSLRMILWSTNPTRATAQQEADRWGYSEIWSGPGYTVYGANRAESPTAYLYWRAGGVDTFAQVDKKPGSQSITELELPIREIMRQQQRYPYPGASSDPRRASMGLDLTRPGHYEFSDFEYKPSNGGSATRVSYTISWSGKKFPGQEKGCFVVAETTGGTQRFGPFSITSMDPDAKGGNEIPVPTDEVENVYVECRSIR